MPPIDPGALALGHIDAVLAARPEKNGHELSAALRCLAEFRDAILLDHRVRPTDASSGRLGMANAVISSVMAIQFPIGPVEWPILEAARTSLASVVEAPAGEGD